MRRGVHVPQHLGRRQTQHVHALPSQPSVARCVSRRAIGHAMTDAVDLYRQASSMTVEVQHKGPSGCCRRNLKLAGEPFSTRQSSTSGRLIVRLKRRALRMVGRASTKAT